MAVNGVAHAFLSRAAQADEIIRTLTARLSALKQAKGAEWCALEAEKLRKENSVLKAQVEKLVHNLSAVESEHGLTQVPLPKHAAEPPSSRVANTHAQVPATEQLSSASPADDTSHAKGAVNKSAASSKDKKTVAKKPDPQTPVTAPKASAGADLPADCSRLLLKVGRVVRAMKHPDADSLYVEEVDLAEGRLRTVVSGLVKHITLDELQGRVGVFLCNLKAAKMRGVLSEAMIMCASTPDKVCIIDPPAGAVPGDRVIFEGYPGEPDEQLNPKKKTWEQVQPDLKTNNDGVATYKGDPFTIPGKGVCRAPGCSNFPIK